MNLQEAVLLAEWILSEDNMNETNERETKSAFLSECVTLVYSLLFL